MKAKTILHIFAIWLVFALLPGHLHAADFTLKGKVVDEDGNGYFNIAYADGEENPERWAYCGELEIVE